MPLFQPAPAAAPTRDAAAPLRELAEATDAFSASPEWKSATSEERKAHVERITGLWDEVLPQVQPDVNPDQLESVAGSAATVLRKMLEDSEEPGLIDQPLPREVYHEVEKLSEVKGIADYLPDMPSGDTDWDPAQVKADEEKRQAARKDFNAKRKDLVMYSGLRPEQVDRLLEDKTALDSMTDKAVVLKATGEVAVPPQWSLDKAQWDAAVDATDASPAKKEKARAMRTRVRDKIADKVSVTIAIADPAWDKWNSDMAREMRSASNGEKVERFLKWRKASGGKTAAIMQSITQNVANIGRQFYGLAAGVTGSDTMAKLASDAGSIAGASAQARKFYGGAGAAGFAADVFGGVAPSVALSPLARLATTAAGAMRVMSAAGAAQSYGGTVADATEAYQAQGLSPKDSRQKAQFPALVSALSTYVLARMLPRGVESAGQIRAGREAAKQSFRNYLGAGVRDFSDEALEEALDQVAHEFTAKMTYDPERDMGQTVNGVIHAGLIGGVGGMVVGGATRYSQAVLDRKAAAARMRMDGFSLSAAEMDRAADLQAAKEYWEQVGREDAFAGVGRKPAPAPAPKTAKPFTHADEGPATAGAAYGRQTDAYDAFGNIQRKTGEPTNEETRQTVPEMPTPDQVVQVRPQAPEVAPSSDPNDYVAALRIGGEVVSGQPGDTHADIYNRFMQEHGRDDAKFEQAVNALADDEAHVFTDEAGNVHTRTEAAAALGEEKPLQSERLRVLRAKKPLDTSSKPAQDAAMFVNQRPLLEVPKTPRNLGSLSNYRDALRRVIEKQENALAEIDYNEQDLVDTAESRLKALNAKLAEVEAKMLREAGREPQYGRPVASKPEPLTSDEMAKVRKDAEDFQRGIDAHPEIVALQKKLDAAEEKFAAARKKVEDITAKLNDGMVPFEEKVGLRNKLIPARAAETRASNEAHSIIGDIAVKKGMLAKEARRVETREATPASDAAKLAEVEAKRLKERTPTVDYMKQAVEKVGKDELKRRAKIARKDNDTDEMAMAYAAEATAKDEWLEPNPADLTHALKNVKVVGAETRKIYILRRTGGDFHVDVVNADSAETIESRPFANKDEAKQHLDDMKLFGGNVLDESAAETRDPAAKTDAQVEMLSLANQNGLASASNAEVTKLADYPELAPTAEPKAGDTATVTLGGRDYPNTTIIRTVKTPEGVKYQVDIFGDKFVTADQISAIKPAKAKPAPERVSAPEKVDTLADMLPPDEVATLATGAAPKSWTDTTQRGDRKMSYRDPRGHVWEISTDYATKTLTLNKQGSSRSFGMKAASAKEVVSKEPTFFLKQDGNVWIIAARSTDAGDPSSVKRIKTLGGIYTDEQMANARKMVDEMNARSGQQAQQAPTPASDAAKPGRGVGTEEPQDKKAEIRAALESDPLPKISDLPGGKKIRDYDLPEGFLNFPPAKVPTIKPTADIITALESVASIDPSRFVLAGIHIAEDGGSKVAVATDGKAIIVVPYEGNLKAGETYSTGRVKGQKPRGQQIEANYPNWKAAIPKNKPKAKILLTDEMLSKVYAAHRASKLVQSASGIPVVIYFNGTGAFFAPGLLLDSIEALKRSGQKKLTLELVGPQEPMTIRGEDRKSIAVLMPSRAHYTRVQLNPPPAPDPLNASGQTPDESAPFYSALTKTVQALPQETMTVAQAQSAEYRAEVAAVELPKGKKVTVEIPLSKVGTGESAGTTQVEMTAYGHLGIRQNTDYKEANRHGQYPPSKFLVTHTPTGLGIQGNVKLRTLEEAKDFVRLIQHTGVDLSKKKFDTEETNRLLQAIKTVGTNEVPDWWTSKRSPDPLNASEPTPDEAAPFYSALTKTVQSLPQETMTVAQARAAIEKGAKKDEITMSGILTDPLSPLFGQGMTDHEAAARFGYKKLQELTFPQPGDKVTKAELLGYALERQSVVSDVVLGDMGESMDGLEEQLMSEGPSLGIRDEAKALEFAARGEYGYFTTEAGRQWARRYHAAYEAGDMNRPTGTHFGQYQLPGADEGSYREMFVTWPESDARKQQSAEAKVIETGDGSWLVSSTRTNPGTNTTANIFKWESTGFAQGGRLFPGGGKGYRASFQGEHFESDSFDAVSDWAKDKVGSVSQRITHEPQWNDGHSQYSDIANPIVRIRRNLRTNAEGKRTYFIEEMQGPGKGEQEKMPPELRKRIYEIGMKRALRDAVYEGADAIGWTTGEQQAERYDLSKQVDAVFHSPGFKPGTYNIDVERDGRSVLAKQDQTPAELAEIVGKELTAKIVAGEGSGVAELKRLSGGDLKVGGEGLKRLYDVTLPSLANDLAKKFGVKVGRSEVGTATKPTFEVLDSEGVSIAGPFITRAEAERELGKYGGVKVQQVGGTAIVHSLPIPEALRTQQRTQGNPLFAQQPDETQENPAGTPQTRGTQPQGEARQGDTRMDEERDGGGAGAGTAHTEASVREHPRPDIAHLEAAGVSVEHGPDGPGGIQYDPAEARIVIDPATQAAHANRIDAAGHDGQGWLALSRVEEAKHAASVLVSGHQWNQIHDAMADGMTSAQMRAIMGVYPTLKNRRLLAEEYVVRLAMRRNGHAMPERASGTRLAAVARLEAELDGKQARAVEQHYENLETVSAEQTISDVPKGEAVQSIVDSKDFERGSIHINLRGGEVDPSRDFTGWVLPAERDPLPNTMNTRYGSVGKTAVYVPEKWVQYHKTKPARIKPGYFPKPEHIGVITKEAIRENGTVDWSKVFRVEPLSERFNPESDSILEAQEPSPDQQDADEDSPKKFKQFFGKADEIEGGREYTPAKWVAAKEVVTSQFFDGSLAVNPATTEKAWDIWTDWTDRFESPKLSGRVLEATGSGLGEAALLAELRKYAAKLATAGDPLLWNSLRMDASEIRRPMTMTEAAQAMAGRGLSMSPLAQAMQASGDALKTVVSETVGDSAAVSALQEEIRKLKLQVADLEAAAKATPAPEGVNLDEWLKTRQGSQDAKDRRKKRAEKKQKEEEDESWQDKQARKFVDKLQSEQTEWWKDKPINVINEVIKDALTIRVDDATDKWAFVNDTAESFIALGVSHDLAVTMSEEIWMERKNREHLKSVRAREAEARRLAELPERTAAKFVDRMQSEQTEWIGNSDVNQVRDIIATALGDDVSYGAEDAEAFLAPLRAQLEAAGVPSDLARETALEVRTEKIARESRAIVKELDRVASGVGSIAYLRDVIFNAPLRLQQNPQWRAETELNFLLDAGIPLEYAIAAQQRFDAELVKTWQKAVEAAAKKVMTSSPKWAEKKKKTPAKAVSDMEKVFRALRAQVMDPSIDWQTRLGMENKWKGLAAVDYGRLQELDDLIHDPQTDRHQRARYIAEVQDKLKSVSIPPHWMHTIAEAYVASALSGVPTLTVNLFSPIIANMRGLFIEIITNPLNTKQAFKAFGDAMSNILSEITFGLKNDAFAGRQNEYLRQTGRLKDMMLSGIATLKDPGAGIVSKTKAVLKILYGSQTLVGRALSALDEAAKATTREFSLFLYTSHALRDAKWDRSRIDAVVTSIQEVKQQVYDHAVADGVSENDARVRATDATLEAYHDAVADNLGEAVAGEAALSARQDSESVVGMLSEGVKEHEEGMASRLVAPLLEAVTRESASESAMRKVMVKMVFGFVNVPFRTMKYFVQASPYGLLRSAVHYARQAAGKETLWKQSYGTRLQAMQRTREAVAGTVGMILLGILSRRSGDDDKEEDIQFTVTGKGPDSSDLAFRDAWLKKWTPFTIHVRAFGATLKIPLGRTGESLLPMFSLAGAVDDLDINRRHSAGMKDPREISAAAEIAGSYFYSFAQRGIFSAFTRLGDISNARQGQPLEKVAQTASYTSSALFPWNSLIQTASRIFTDPKDRSSVKTALLANSPVGMLVGKPAINSLGDVVGDTSAAGRMLRNGSPVVVAARNSDSPAYALILKYGQAPAAINRKVIERGLGKKLTDEQWYQFSLDRGHRIKALLERDAAELSTLKPKFDEKKGRDVSAAEQFNARLDKFSLFGKEHATKRLKERLQNVR